MSSPSTPCRPKTFSITACTSTADLATVSELFRAYVAWLNIDLTYQDIATELATLPGKYAPERGGALFLARDTSGETEEVLGVVALRALTSESDIEARTKRCEMKRLYVTPAGRGRGIGRALAQRAVAEAEQRGYEEMVLDTLPYMIEARAVYARLGFVECEAYYDTPIEGTVFLRKVLAAGSRLA